MAFDDFSEPETLGMSRERLDRIPEFYRKNYLDTKKLPNISTLVARGGEVDEREHEGDVRSDGCGRSGARLRDDEPKESYLRQ